MKRIFETSMPSAAASVRPHRINSLAHAPQRQLVAVPLGDAAARLHGNRNSASEAVGEFFDDIRFGEAPSRYRPADRPKWRAGSPSGESACRIRLPLPWPRSGASGAIVSFSVDAKGRTSYSTLMASAASWARSSVSAATRATTSPCRLSSCGSGSGRIRPPRDVGTLQTSAHSCRSGCT